MNTAIDFRKLAETYFAEHRDDFPRVGALTLPLLNLAQETLGYVSDEAITVIADVLGTSATDVMGVASFYTLLDRKPPGKHIVRVCTNISCGVLSSFKPAAYFCEKLGVPLGGTTTDGNVTVRAVECLADCDHAPCVMFDDEQIGTVTQEKADAVLARLKDQSKDEQRA